MYKIFFIILALVTPIVAIQKSGMDLLEVLDYIKIVDDSVEIKVKTPCYRKVLFDASPAGYYINSEESEMIHAGKSRRYYDKIALLELANYASRYGEYLNKEGMFTIKINTNADNLFYYIPTLQSNSLMLHIKSVLSKTGYRAFYILNQYGVDYRLTDKVVLGDGTMELNEPREIGFKVKYSGYIYIPKHDDASFDQFRLKLKVLTTQSRGFNVVIDDNGIIIVVPDYFEKSSVAP